MVNEIYQLKWEYNNILKRYYDGCNYIEEHPKEAEKYLPIILKFLDKINELLDKIQKVHRISEQEILGGFEFE